MRLLLSRSLFAVLAASLTSCAMFARQDEVLAGMEMPTKPEFVELVEPVRLTFNRGMIDSEFFAELPAGTYKPIMENAEGRFYLSPIYDFTYGTQSKTVSEIGGLWVPTNPAEPAHVWYLPQYMDPLTAWADMSMPKHAIKASEGATGWRPWVETEFELPRSTFAFVPPPDNSEMIELPNAEEPN